jgi:transcriptional regulator with XRE-family HTH domain
MEDIGNKIRLLRVVSGYPQEYIAFQLGISQSAYSRQESGRTQLSLIQIKTICKVYELTMMEFLENSINDLMHKLVKSHSIGTIN